MSRNAFACTVALVSALVFALAHAALAQSPRPATTRPAPRRPASRPARRATAPQIYEFPAATGRGQPATAPAGPTEEVCQAALDWLDRARPFVDKLVPMAEQAAERLMEGGTLYVAGNGGFVDEYDYRAGGFPFTKPWTGEQLEDNDVLLIGSFRPNEMENRHARIEFVARGWGRRFGPGMVIHLSGHAWPQISRSLPMVNARFWRGRLHLVDTGAPLGASLKDLCLGQLSATALGWALHGEIIAAATRKGKTLATYASDWEPNGRQWDASVKGKHIHPKYQIPPTPAGEIGKRYLKICARQLSKFATTQPGQVRLAGRRMAACIQRGGVVWAVSDGHILPRGAVAPPELGRIKMFGRSYDWRYNSRLIPKGDLVLWMGYLRYPRGTIEPISRRGCEAVVVTVDDGPTTDRVTHIGSCWSNYDTVIDLPEYPIRVLPSSGILHTAQWYALMAETLAAPKADP